MTPNRRDFLKLAGLAAAGLTGCAGGGGTSVPWTRRELDFLQVTAGKHGGRSWAAWDGRRRLAAWNPSDRGPTLSITKSIATLAASRAATDGWLSPSERVADTLTEWRGDSMKSQITVRMLLQQVSGLEAGVIALYRNQPRDKGRAAVSLRCVDAPGTVFRYGPGHWETLAEVMRRKLARKNEKLFEFMRRAVMTPISLNANNWRSDRQGTPYFSTGTELNVDELGRLGFAIGRLLSGKNVHGIAAENFAAMASPSAVNPMFGGGLWRNTRANRTDAAAIEVERLIDNPMSASFWSRACLSRRQPIGMVALIGSSGRRVYIWPDEEKRFARLAWSGAKWSDVTFLSRLG
jgi:CubicO group peptidase (beta-lactamase class C family)